MTNAPNEIKTHQKPAEPPRLLDPVVEGIPASLQAIADWTPWEAVWRPEKKQGRGGYDKVPKRAENSSMGISTRVRWSPFDKAWSAWWVLSLLTPGGGVGIRMDKAHGIWAIDLDGCVLADGTLAPWAAEIIERAGTYAEKSPSGQGARLFLQGDLPEDWTQVKPEKVAQGVGGIECYGGSSPRFVTVTGHRFDGCPTEVNECPEGFREWLEGEYRMTSAEKKGPKLPMPELAEPEDLPALQDLDLPPHARAFLDKGEYGMDGSRALTAATIALLQATEKPVGVPQAGVVLALLSDNLHAWDLAMRHRNDNPGKALSYLWEHHVCKALGRRKAEGQEFGEVEDTPEAPVEENYDGVFIGNPEKIQYSTLEEVPDSEWIAEPMFPVGDVGGLAGPGGSLKSGFSLAEAIFVVAGRPDVLGCNGIFRRTSAYFFCAEDKVTDTARRALAICQEHGIPVSAINGDEGFSLFIGSGVVQGLHLMRYTDKGRTPKQTEAVKALIAFLKKHNIGLVVLDPLVALHGLQEADQQAMDAVIRTIQHIAAEARAHILVVLHTRKPDKASSDGYHGDMDAVRGASAIVNAMRVVRTLFGMSLKEAVNYGLENEERLRVFGVTDAKNNHAPLRPETFWYKRKLVRGAGRQSATVAPVKAGLSPARKASRDENTALAGFILRWRNSRQEAFPLNEWHELRKVMDADGGFDSEDRNAPRAFKRAIFKDKDSNSESIEGYTVELRSQKGKGSEVRLTPPEAFRAPEDGSV